MLTEALGRRVRQARQAVEEEPIPLVLAEALGRIIINLREFAQIHGLLIRQELLSDLFGESSLGHRRSPGTPPVSPPQPRRSTHRR